MLEPAWATFNDKCVSGSEEELQSGHKLGLKQLVEKLLKHATFSVL